LSKTVSPVFIYIGLDFFLHDCAFEFALLGGILGVKCLPHAKVENLVKASSVNSTTLGVTNSTNLSSHSLCLVFRDVVPVFTLESVSEIRFVANQENRDAGAVHLEFWLPLVENVFERISGDEAKANEKHIRLWVTEGAKSVIVLLPSSVPQREINDGLINSDVAVVVVEHGRDVVLGNLIRAVAHHDAGFSDGAIANSNAFDWSRGHVDLR